MLWERRSLSHKTGLKIKEMSRYAKTEREFCRIARTVINLYGTNGLYYMDASPYNRDDKECSIRPWEEWQNGSLIKIGLAVIETSFTDVYDDETGEWCGYHGWDRLLKVLPLGTPV